MKSFFAFFFVATTCFARSECDQSLDPANTTALVNVAPPTSTERDPVAEAITPEGDLAQEGFRPLVKGRKNPDLYAVLGVRQDATEEEIRKRYKRATKLYHPDRGQHGSRTAEETLVYTTAFQAVRDAGDLRNSEKREKYDRFGRIDSTPPPGSQPGFTAETWDKIEEAFFTVFPGNIAGTFSEMYADIFQKNWLGNLASNLGDRETQNFFLRIAKGKTKHGRPSPQVRWIATYYLIHNVHIPEIQKPVLDLVFSFQLHQPFELFETLVSVTEQEHPGSTSLLGEVSERVISSISTSLDQEWKTQLIACLGGLSTRNSEIRNRLWQESSTDGNAKRIAALHALLENPLPDSDLTEERISAAKIFLDKVAQLDTSPHQYQAILLLGTIAPFRRSAYDSLTKLSVSSPRVRHDQSTALKKEIKEIEASNPKDTKLPSLRKKLKEIEATPRDVDVQKKRFAQLALGKMDDDPNTTNTLKDTAADHHKDRSVRASAVTALGEGIENPSTREFLKGLYWSENPLSYHLPDKVGLAILEVFDRVDHPDLRDLIRDSYKQNAHGSKAIRAKESELIRQWDRESGKDRGFWWE